jgi:prepilin-type N-terminal cleavage/methylation domain-containing protein
MLHKLKRNKGLTLVELMVAMMIIGLSIASMLATCGAFTRLNSGGVDLSTAEFLIEEMKGLTDTLAVTDPNGGTHFGNEESNVSLYDDVDDFHEKTYADPYGPIDIDRNVLADFAEFKQKVTVRNVNNTDFDDIVGNHQSKFYRVTVDVYKNDILLTSASWIRTKVDWGI